MKRNKKLNEPRNSESIFTKNGKILKIRFPLLWQHIQITLNATLPSQSFDENDKPIEARIEKYKHLFYRGEDSEKFVGQLIEGWRFDPYDVLFFIGMGLCYLPVEATSKGVGNPQMVIIEPSEQVFRYTLENIDLESLLINDRIDLFIGDTVSIASIVDRYQDSIPIGRNQIIVHPEYEAIFGVEITAIKQELTERISAVRDNWFTTKKFGQQMFTNAVTNLPSLFFGTPMKNLRGKFKGLPAVCVAAGPSLDHAIPELMKLQTHALLIACDSAVNALLKAGIRPHVVVTTDIFKTNIDKLKPHFEALCETVFIYSIESNPDNVRLYLGDKRVAVSAYNKLLLSCLGPTLKLQSKFPAMTSVSHMAIFSAIALGADPIVLVGMDLAYSKGKSHSFDSAFFHSLDQKKMVPTLGNDGSMIPSAPQFVADKLLIEKIVAQTSDRFINTSLNGAYIAGTELKRLAEVADVECTAHLEGNALMEGIDWTPAADEFAASTIIKNLNGQFLAFKELCSNKKQELLDEINKIEKRPQAKILSKKMKAFEKTFDEFQEKHQIYNHMIKEIMLGDLEEILKEKEILSVCADKKGADILVESLNLLLKNYEIYEKGMDFQIDQLQQFDKFLSGLDELKHGLDGSDKDCDKHIQLARYFENVGELWQAKREYEYCMSRQPDDITPYLGLARAYVKEHLWRPAQAVCNSARTVFSDAPELEKLEIEIETGIDGIFDEIKKEWMQGNMQTTRKLLNQYLILRPDDLQANELKRVVRELDEEFCGEWVEEEKEQSVKPDMQTRFKKAVTQIKNKQLEQGVGILEGLVDDFPEIRSGLREQIGDIRMMQKEYNSALWNYRQVLLTDPMRLDIKNKIHKVEAIQSRRSAQMLS